MPDRFHTSRKHIRLPNFDYTLPADYFVTICSHKKRSLFGGVENDEMQLSEIGKIVETCWKEIPNHFINILLGAFVIMPNHIHGILHIEMANGRGPIYRAPTEDEELTIEGFQKPVNGSIPTIIRTFKAAVTRVAGCQHFQLPIWQRNYYEHIIRNDKEFQEIGSYILNNPHNWLSDDENYLDHDGQR